MKKLVSIFSLVTVLGLSACSHENPIESQPPEDTVNFLMAASIYASNKMELKSSDFEKKGNYEDCVFNRVFNASFCPKFYDYMLEFAKESNTPFSRLSLKDLENKESYKKIESLYFKTLMASITVKRNK